MRLVSDGACLRSIVRAPTGDAGTSKHTPGWILHVTSELISTRTPVRNGIGGRDRTVVV